eukprot:494623-Amphidinium_carterae.1
MSLILEKGLGWPTAEYLRCVRNFRLLVGPKLRERPEAWPRVRLPAPAKEDVEVPPLAEPGEHQQQTPHVEGPHRSVVTYNTIGRCFDCHRQT